MEGDFIAIGRRVYSRGGFHETPDSLIKLLDGLIKRSNSLIKLLEPLIQPFNSLIKLFARNQEPRTKIPRKVFLRILVPGIWVED